MDTIALIGSTLGLSFVAGMRLYATVLALGLAIRFEWLHLGTIGQPLLILAHPAVLIAAGIACFIEFFADKVPWVDTVWDSFHTFIRPVGAAILAATILGHTDPVFKLTLIILCGGVAFASHGSKAASRLIINHSPEPFTNIGISLIEDVFALAGVWLSIKHPFLALSAVIIFVGMFAWLTPKIFRLARRRLTAFRAWMAKRKLKQTERMQERNHTHS